MINPEGSTEGGELALKIADGVATHVDAAVMKTIQQSLKAINEASSAEMAQQTKQMLYEYLRAKGLTGPELEYAGIPKDFFKNVPAGKGENSFAMSKADGLGEQASGLKNTGFDSTGKSLSFSEESGIQLEQTRPGQDNVWDQVPVVRGNDVHVGLGENLPSNTKTIDKIVFKDGVAESIKSINPKDVSYASEKAFESKLQTYVNDLEQYAGRQTRSRQGLQWRESYIEEKILHIGIPDGAISPDQIEALENVGKRVAQYNENLPLGKAPIKIKVTVLK